MRLTIKQFQELFDIIDVDISEIDKSIIIVKTLTGYDDNQIQKMKPKKFIEICNHAKKTIDAFTADIQKGNVVNSMKVGGVKYKIESDIRQMTASQYVEAITFSQDVVKNMHKILASMATPMKWTWKGYKADETLQHRQKSELLLDAHFDISFSSIKRLYNTIEAINKEFEYLWQNNETDNNKPIAKGFSKVWGWVYSCKQVSELQGISMDEAWKLPVYQFLNDLSYLKMLREVEDEERRHIEFRSRR